MIQRIQTIYLLLAAILMAVTGFSPILELKDGVMLLSYGLVSEVDIIKSTWGILSMAGLSAIFSLVIIFLYKNRKRQANLVLLNMLVIVFYYITTLVYMTSYINDFFNSISSVAYGIAFPVLSLLLLLLAHRAIVKDDKLVRSSNRIR